MSCAGCVIAGIKGVEGGERIRYDLSWSGSGSSPGVQPPGSVMELDPRTLVVVRRGSLLPRTRL